MKYLKYFKWLFSRWYFWAVESVFFTIFFIKNILTYGNVFFIEIISIFITTFLLLLIPFAIIYFIFIKTIKIKKIS